MAPLLELLIQKLIYREPDRGELYIVRHVPGSDIPHLYVWNDPDGWQQVGSLEGVIVPEGPMGPVVVIKESFETVGELKMAHPTGERGDAYLVCGDLYVWDTEAKDWKRWGICKAPAGGFKPGDSLFTAADSSGGSAEVGYGEPLTFVSSTLDIEVTQNPATVRIDNPGYTLQFSSVTPASVRAVFGQCSTVVVVGIGNEDFIATNEDPVIIARPALSIKMITGGTITEEHYFLFVTAPMLDASVPTVYGRLYSASPLNSREFHYVPGTEVSMFVP